MKVGDIFVEGDCKYKVLEVVPEGYIATMIEGMDTFTEDTVKNSDSSVEETAQPSGLEEKPLEITDDSVKFSKTQINRMPNSELESLCKKMGLEVGTGTEMKRSLISKLGL